jgi:hypothetical protein
MVNDLTIGVYYNALCEDLQECTALRVYEQPVSEI